MQEAVDENRVERPERTHVFGLEIGTDETPRIFRPGTREVPLIDVDADVFRPEKAPGVRAGSAADVEDAAHGQTVDSSLDRSKFLGDKRRLPGGIDGRMFHEPLDDLHYRHLTSKRSNR